MRILSEVQKTYKTQENAIKAAEKKLGAEFMKENSNRWIVAVNPEGRFHVVFIGQDTIHLVFDGFGVAA